MTATPRGAVLMAIRAIGFGTSEPARFLVLQSEDLNDVLPTLVVAPIDSAPTLTHPLIVPIGPREIGAPKPGHVFVSMLAAVPRDRFELRPVGRATATTLSRVDAAIRLLLGVDRA